MTTNTKPDISPAQLELLRSIAKTPLTGATDMLREWDNLAILLGAHYIQHSLHSATFSITERGRAKLAESEVKP
jgi:hypothetical protein